MDKMFIIGVMKLVGKIKKGSKIYLPTAEALNSEFISSEKKLLISAKLQNWIDNQITSSFKTNKRQFR